MGEAAAVISAISALVAVGLTIAIYSLTRLKERPVISFVKAKIKLSLETAHLSLEFKNIGRNPAIEVKVHMFACLKEEHLAVKKIDSVHIVNQKDPGISFYWDVEAKIPKHTRPLDFLFYIGLTYQDIFTNKDYLNEIWLIHKTGELKLKDMDIRDYRKMKKAMEKIIFYQDLHKKFYEIIRRKRRRINDILPKTFQKATKFLERAFGKGRETR